MRPTLSLPVRRCSALAGSRSQHPRRRTGPLLVLAISPTDLSSLTGISTEEAEAALDRCPALCSTLNSTVSQNVSLLRGTYKPHVVNTLIRGRPDVLAARLEEWLQFLTGYGLSDDAVWRVLRYSPGLLGGGSNTPYNTGAAIVFLKSYGWTDDAVAERILPCYPEVLAATPEQLQAAVDFLRSRHFDEEAVRRVVLNFPHLLSPSHSAGLFELIDRIRASAHNKYVVSGSYHV